MTRLLLYRRVSEMILRNRFGFLSTAKMCEINIANRANTQKFGQKRLDLVLLSDREDFLI